jgi:hypothetical protein
LLPVHHPRLRGKARHGRQAAFGGLAPFDPVLLTGGAVTAWLRNNTLSGAISSVPDVLNPANPAVQGTAGQRPTGNADGSMSFDGGDCLQWPLIAANNGRDSFGLAFGIKQAAFPGFTFLFAISNLASGASAQKIVAYSHFSGAIVIVVFTGPNTGRQFGSPSATLAAGVAKYLTFEYDNIGGATELDKMVLTAGGAVKVLAPSNFGSPPAIGQLTLATGNMIIGAEGADGSSGVAATYSQNILSLGAKQAGSGPGLLTPAARAGLALQDPLT